MASHKLALNEKMYLESYLSHIVEHHSYLENQQAMKVMCSVTGQQRKAMVLTDRDY